jgi:hypothetical protein
LGQSSQSRSVRVAVVGIAFAFAAGGFKVALAASSDDPSPPAGSSTVATSTDSSPTTSAPSSTDAGAPQTPSPDAATPSPDPAPAPVTTVTKHSAASTVAPRRAPTTSTATASSVKVSPKPTAVAHPVLHQTTSRAAPAPRAHRLARARFPRVEGLPAPKRQYESRPRARHAEPATRLSVSSALVTAEAGVHGSDSMILFLSALMAFGAVLLLVAATPAQVVPLRFTQALESRRVDLGVLGLAVVVNGLALLAIGR